MKILLIPVWMLSVCLAVGGVTMAAAPIWRQDCLYWTAAVFIGIVIPTAVLANELQKEIWKRLDDKEKIIKRLGWKEIKGCTVNGKRIYFKYNDKNDPKTLEQAFNYEINL